MNRIRVALIAACATFAIMVAYEFIKEYYLAGQLTSWQSHWITICVTTILSAFITWLAVNQFLKVQARATALEMREEKLKTLSQVMRLVDHHVNNLGNTLQLVDFELQNDGAPKEETVKTLLSVVDRTSTEMRRLHDIEDPFDEEHFEITFR